MAHRVYSRSQLNRRIIRLIRQEKTPYASILSDLSSSSACLKKQLPKTDSENGVSVSRNRAGEVDDGTGFPSLPTKEKRP